MVHKRENDDDAVIIREHGGDALWKTITLLVALLAVAVTFSVATLRSAGDINQLRIDGAVRDQKITMLMGAIQDMKDNQKATTRAMDDLTSAVNTLIRENK